MIYYDEMTEYEKRNWDILLIQSPISKYCRALIFSISPSAREQFDFKTRIWGPTGLGYRLSHPDCDVTRWNIAASGMMQSVGMPVEFVLALWEKLLYALRLGMVWIGEYWVMIWELSLWLGEYIHYSKIKFYNTVLLK